MKYQDVLQDLLLNDPIRMKALYAVQALELSDGWIGAGLVRDAVWDHLHGYGQRPVSGDVDVVWFDPKNCSSVVDSVLEETLSRQSPVFNWSVKNQARMHQRNDNEPYCSTANALRYWPETATAVAVRIPFLRSLRLMGSTICLNDVFGQRHSLRAISGMFSGSVSWQNGGWNAIRICS